MNGKPDLTDIDPSVIGVCRYMAFKILSASDSKAECGVEHLIHTRLVHEKASSHPRGKQRATKYRRDPIICTAGGWRPGISAGQTCARRCGRAITEKEIRRRALGSRGPRPKQVENNQEGGVERRQKRLVNQYKNSLELSPMEKKNLRIRRGSQPQFQRILLLLLINSTSPILAKHHEQADPQAAHSEAGSRECRPEQRPTLPHTGHGIKLLRRAGHNPPIRVSHSQRPHRSSR
ncbi:hypothetical protein MAPG_04052 [Magnaporthiopsis poae ATCC 64411]|uniref:Uncharacterized protein n=1 Tax=Magnaporthiopsis poae (strain ATCC 64411 / 73-15) TaxID=644358 RepID=A0A0C4DVP3_MAGP6|nr:hypothetical protein MAPG_04052 [Magnaporthiopsis poae ATCC 64411]